VLDDALEFIEKLLDENKDEKLWIKLLDPTHLIYKSETESNKDIQARVLNKIADSFKLADR